MTQAHLSKWLKIIILLVGFFVGYSLLFLLNMSHPAVLLLSLLVIAFVMAVSAAALAHLVQKAVALQEQSDLTI